MNYLVHYGTPRHSGRYPYGSGENPYQRAKGNKRKEYKIYKEGRQEYGYELQNALAGNRRANKSFSKAWDKLGKVQDKYGDNSSQAWKQYAKVLKYDNRRIEFSKEIDRIRSNGEKFFNDARERFKDTPIKDIDVRTVKYGSELMEGFMSKNAAVWTYFGFIGSLPANLAQISDQNYYIRKKNKEYDLSLDKFIEEGLKSVR